MPLFLLDAHRPDNRPSGRWITSQLYVGDPVTRLSQYVLLGVGGMRALGAMGIEPSVLHLNEGHAAFAVLELARGEAAGGLGVIGAAQMYWKAPACARRLRPLSLAPEDWLARRNDAR